MRSYEINDLYHGSYENMPVGKILSGRNQAYEDSWGASDFYHILEKYRPDDQIPHRQAVFLCEYDDIDVVGAPLDFIYLMKPLSKVFRYDMNWGSEVSCLVSDGATENEIKQAASNYWSGTPHHNETVWEYLTSKAQILELIEEN